MKVPVGVYDRLVDALYPLMEDVTQRRAIVCAGLYDSGLLDQVDYRGAGKPFTKIFLIQVMRYDEYLLPRIIQQAMDFAGGQSLKCLQTLHDKIVHHLYNNDPDPPPGNRIIIIVLDQETADSMSQENLLEYVQYKLQNGGDDVRFIATLEPLGLHFRNLNLSGKRVFMLTRSANQKTTLVPYETHFLVRDQQILDSPNQKRVFPTRGRIRLRDLYTNYVQ